MSESPDTSESTSEGTVAGGAGASGSSPAGKEPTFAGLSGEWQRLHPLSPLVRTGRGLAVLLVLLIPTGSRHGSGGANGLIHLGVIALLFVLALISWLVTHWRVEAGVLRVDSGLVRRTSERFPLTQIQAIDVVRPGLARIFGLTELRIRVAGGGRTAGRLAYLTNPQAEQLRARLLEMSRDARGPGRPATERAGTAASAGQGEGEGERLLYTASSGMLAASLLLTNAGLAVELAIVGLAVLAVLAPAAASGAISGGAVAFAGLVLGLVRRFNGSYRMTVSHTSDGLHLRAGLVQTTAETIPSGRIQAVRMVEPLAWRPFGWVRLEVDIASQRSRGRQDRNESKSARALVPVGRMAEAQAVLASVFEGLPRERRPPPARARWKSPLRFRLLSWAVNDRYAVATSGRIRRVSDWVPLAKVQSVRCVQGPVQRRLGLASVHLDTAGRNVHAVARDRDRAEAAELLRELPERCRHARGAD